MAGKKQQELFTGKDLANLETEKEFQKRVTDVARINGWTCYSIPDSRFATLSGYPDLTMWRSSDQRLIFAELKREKGRLRPAQDVILEELRNLAPRIKAEVYVWRPSHWTEILLTLKRP
jgi:hypothetical protein